MGIQGIRVQLARIQAIVTRGSGRPATALTLRSPVVVCSVHFAPRPGAVGFSTGFLAATGEPVSVLRRMLNARNLVFELRWTIYS